MTDPPPPPPPPPPSFGTPPPSSGPDVGAALSYGWKKFQENVGPLIAIVAIPVAIQVVIGIISSIAIRSSVIVWALLQIISFVVGPIAALGITRAALMVTAGESIDFNKAFQYDRWGEWFVFSIVFGLMVGVGLVLCLIPGLFVLAFFGLAPFYFIDGRMSLGDALTASRTAVTSKGLAFPVLLSIIVGALGVIACGVGILVTYPVAYIAVAFLYRYSVGQPVAA